MKRLCALLVVLSLAAACGGPPTANAPAPAAQPQPAPAADPLPSWNETASKKAIVAFVAKVTKEGWPDFVAPAERIATFDNDGTLWCEQPMYFQLLFALDRVKALRRKHPEWKDEGAVCVVLKGDMKGGARRRREGACSRSSWRRTPA